ncbi:general amidase, putative [Talaromyces stipitatus ATCC 10500]|uniref:amidase n=1 Tax=Talaromyces stipitatus (strain ATCC 10500 / CBS 375.48 / QM 6759 / NRRL 1006) TaxID=441959 RepID=B8M0E9_TALSN|nr:general amidase, putative [Talaromyces stipitatus ATCC 10500]EED21246.1 general amidase, putative [Talaromyces stipitatus ATCC 10500]
MAQPAYIDISTSKWEQVSSSLIPAEWRLDDKYIPRGMRLSPSDSVHKFNEFGDEYETSLFDIPRKCGILTAREVRITEGYDVQSLLKEIAEKGLSAEEVTLAFCKRTAIAQQLTRCITEPLFSSALAQARQLDDHLARTGQTVGLFHGLPVSVKDNFNIKGVDSSLGVAALSFRPATQNAALVDLLHSLGAVIIAKTNIPQTLGLLDSVNHVFGRTLNPSNPQLTPGGSSGGEGVLVAMRGSMIGFGTDLGGSIRIPAMCNNIYGMKPSVGRISYEGQTGFGLGGSLHVALKPTAGPIARSVQDIDFVMRELVPRGEVFANDCIPGFWPSTSVQSMKKLRVGILRHDGLVTPLPPITNILNEVGRILANSKIVDIEVVDIPTPPIMKDCFVNAGRLMSVDGSIPMLDLIFSTDEPLVPSLKGMSRRKPYTIEELCSMNAQREKIEIEMRKSLWSLPPSSASGQIGHVDAIILPVAAHPVPRHDQYGCVSYTSAFNLLDYPAGVIPVRKMTEADLRLEMNPGEKVLSRWDANNKKLWQGDRSVYLNSPLSVQVVTPKLHDYELCQAMSIIDSTLKDHYGQKEGNRAML